MNYTTTIDNLPFEECVVKAKARSLHFATVNHTFYTDDAAIYISAGLNLIPLPVVAGEPQDFAIKSDSQIHLIAVADANTAMPLSFSKEKEAEILQSVKRNIIFDIQYAEENTGAH